ncbi:MAG: hypothetical protein KA419_15315 [Acidobacteria bacterium]|nr:hypothetical protein [Acidobacteriota bacterium]
MVNHDSFGLEAGRPLSLQPRRPGERPDDLDAPDDEVNEPEFEELPADNHWEDGEDYDDAEWTEDGAEEWDDDDEDEEEWDDDDEEEWDDDDEDPEDWDDDEDDDYDEWKDDDEWDEDGPADDEEGWEEDEGYEEWEGDGKSSKKWGRISGDEADW